ncbi:putative protein unc-13, mammalian uncoordinated 13, domain 2 [Dioscorea sansibarensis]
MDASRLLHLYRRDRRKLLEFVLSSAPAEASSDSALDLSAVDLDTLSIDYVLDRVQSGGMLDFSEATKQFFDEMKFPVMLKSSSPSTFFLISDMNMSGSPPQRNAPQILSNVTNDRPSCLSKQSTPYSAPEVVQYGVETGSGVVAAKVAQVQLGNDANFPSLGLPALRTGLSDDDVRETAYEVLLASLFLSGVRVHFSEEKKRSRYFKGLRSKRDESNHRSQPIDSYSELLDIIRVQLEISESMDALIKQGLRGFCSATTNENVDVPQTALELLTTISKSDFSNEKAYMHWHKRQVNTLEELLLGSHGFVTGQKLSIFFSELKNITTWVSNNGSAGHVEVLTALRRFASSLSSKPGKFGIPSETYYWTDSYHLNLRLYEKFLSGVFDVLEDGQIIEVAEEIISIFKLTWPTLGITKRIHDILYCWVLFQQFTRTGEVTLLELAFFEIHKFASRSDGDVNEEAYLRSLFCSAEAYRNKKKMNLIDAVFFNIKWWCGNQLEDYHLHFNEDNTATYESMMTLAIFVEEYLADECRDNECSKLMDGTEATSNLVQSFVEKSIQAAYKRVLDLLDIKSKMEQKHPLAILANELKLIAEKDANVFIPVLSLHFPQVRMHYSRILHELYGEQLRPFLESVTHLSEGAISVLAASTNLERSLTKILGSMCGDGVESLCSNHLQPYQIKDVCLPLILHWVNTRHDYVLEWTKRAIHMEDWEPLSSQQRQAASVVEVFRIIEETIDQFFKLDVPMDMVHLRSLLSGIVRSLEAYLLRIVNEQVDKKNLYPAPPALTRYEELINPFLKKKSVECNLVEEKVSSQLSCLTASKLCVKLNTLHYIRDQLDALEESMKSAWLHVCSVNGQPAEELSTSCEPVDELFTLFDDIRRNTHSASDLIIDFIGARVIFWDLRNSFLSSLYKGSVESACLEMFLPQLDEVLNSICGLILDVLRDQVVLSICRAAMDGYVWVMLDGGPSRVFSETDVIIMQEDLNILKDLFIADGQGLPRSVVEKEATLAQQILDLYAMKTETIIEMLRNVSDQVYDLPYHNNRRTRSVKNTYTLLRILCHKKDKDASKYLKLHYQLPRSSDYDDSLTNETASRSPLLTDVFRRSTSVNWTEKGQSSFRSIKSKLHEVTSELKRAPW